jgi:hypothetical protein
MLEKQDSPRLSTPDTAVSKDSTVSSGKPSVKACEDLFLQGRFKEALLAANQYLAANAADLSQSNPPSPPDSRADSPNVPSLSPHYGLVREATVTSTHSSKCQPIVIDLQDSLYFDFDVLCRPRGFSVLLSPPSHSQILLDRAAAVALQAWYEICTRTTKTDTHKGHVHLQAFFEAYSNNSLGMSLFLVWIYFCQALDHHEQALTMAAETIKGLIHETDLVRSIQEDGRELVLVWFTQLLPLVRDTRLLTDILQSISRKAVLKPNKVKLDKTVNLETMRVLIDLLDESSSSQKSLHTWENWPYWLRDVFPECTSRLERLLQKRRLQLKQQQEEEMNKRARVDAAQSPTTIIPTPSLSTETSLTVSGNTSKSLPDYLQDDYTRLLQHCSMAWHKAHCFLQKQQTTQDWQDLFDSLYKTTRAHVRVWSDDCMRRLAVLNHMTMTYTADDWKRLARLVWMRVIEIYKMHVLPRLAADKREQTAKSSVLPVLAYIGWRQRHWIAGTTQKALLILAIKPVLEILHALTPVAGQV